MTTVTITQAKRRLAELADRVSAGERITVTRDGEPVLEMVAPEPSRKGGLDLVAIAAALDKLGVEQFFTYVADDFDAPLPEDFLITPEP